VTPTDAPRTRKKLALAATTVVALSAIAVAHVQSGASAEPVDSSIAAGCTIGGSNVDVTVAANVDDKVDPVTEGGQETLVTKTGAPSIPVEVTINKIVVTTPTPPDIASIDTVSFTGGNVTGSYEISGSNLVVTFTGPVSSKDIQVPTVTTVDTVKSGVAPATIEWKTFSELDADTNYGLATCKPKDANQNLNTTAVVAAGSATTVSPTTTGPSSTDSPTTTEPSGTPTTTTAPSPTTSPTTTSPSGPVTVSGAASVPVPGVPSAPMLPVPSMPGLPGSTGSCAVPPVNPVPVPVPALPVPVPCPPVPVPAAPSAPGGPSAPSVPSVPSVPAPAVPSPSVGVTIGVGVTVGS
jgi:hypothetical protein